MAEGRVHLHRERLIEARVGGEPLDPAKLYTVSSSAFLANGGDGYAMLAAGRLTAPA